MVFHCSSLNTKIFFVDYYFPSAIGGKVPGKYNGARISLDNRCNKNSLHIAISFSFEFACSLSQARLNN
jgi:hypothetical protein